MSNILISYVLRFVVILPAIVIHEVSHGYCAYLMGDPTAKRAGRLTLNPIKHIDRFGTVILPAFLLLVSGGRFSFGYAKPVPVNPNYFKNYRVGFFITSIAGPASNVALAVLSGMGVRALGATGLLAEALYFFAMLNLALVFFNLIPIPPLDGSRVIPLFLTDAGLRKYQQIEQYGFGILMVLLWGVPTLFRGFDPLGMYLSYTVDPLLRIITGVR